MAVDWTSFWFGFVTALAIATSLIIGLAFLFRPKKATVVNNHLHG